MTDRQPMNYFVWYRMATDTHPVACLLENDPGSLAGFKTVTRHRTVKLEGEDRTRSLDELREKYPCPDLTPSDPPSTEQSPEQSP